MTGLISGILSHATSADEQSPWHLGRGGWAQRGLSFHVVSGCGISDGAAGLLAWPPGTSGSPGAALPRQTLGTHSVTSVPFSCPGESCKSAQGRQVPVDTSAWLLGDAVGRAGFRATARCVPIRSSHCYPDGVVSEHVEEGRRTPPLKGSSHRSQNWHRAELNDRVSIQCAKDHEGSLL